MLNEFSTESSAESRVEPDRSCETALNEVESACGSGSVGNDQDRNDTKDCVRDAVKYLDRY